MNKYTMLKVAGWVLVLSFVMGIVSQMSMPVLVLTGIIVAVIMMKKRQGRRNRTARR